MKNTLNVGILGCGRISSTYYDCFSRGIEGIKLSSVSDLIESKTKKFVKRFDCNYYQDSKSFINDNEIDAVIILTESGNHYRDAKHALNNGKHVITEKPACLIPNQITTLGKLAKKNNLMYATIYQNRFNPALKKTKEILEKGLLGNINMISARVRWCREQDYYEDGWHGTWKMDGGVVSQQAIHHLDALQWISGGVKKVVSHSSNQINKLEAEDTNISLLEFDNGSVGTFEATTSVRPKDYDAEISIFGSEGFIVVGGLSMNKIIELRSSKIDDCIKIKKQFSENVKHGYGVSHPRILDETLKRLKEGIIEPPIDYIEAKKSVLLMNAIYESSHKKKWVNLNSKNKFNKLGR